MAAYVLTRAFAYALFAKFASALTGKKFTEKSAVGEMAKRKADNKLTAKKMTKKTLKLH